MPQPTVVVDVHEKASMIPELLADSGAEVKLEKLTVADYILSEECAVERKTVRDLMNSLFRGRIFDQAKRLVEAYPKPVLVVEGNLSTILDTEALNPRAIWGCLSKLGIDMDIAVFQTTSAWDTAQFLYTLASREQITREKTIQIRQKLKKLSFEEQQLYVLTGLPYIGTKLAERLLKHFGTIQAVFKASERELKKVSGIGKKKAREIHKLIKTPYRERGSKQKKLGKNQETAAVVQSGKTLPSRS